MFIASNQPFTTVSSKPRRVSQTNTLESTVDLFSGPKVLTKAKIWGRETKAFCFTPKQGFIPVVFSVWTLGLFCFIPSNQSLGIFHSYRVFNPRLAAMEFVHGTVEKSCNAVFLQSLLCHRRKNERRPRGKSIFGLNREIGLTKRSNLYSDCLAGLTRGMRGRELTCR